MKTKESPRYLSKMGKREVGCFTGRARGMQEVMRGDHVEQKSIKTSPLKLSSC